MSAAQKLSDHWLLQLNTDDMALARQIAREHSFNVVHQVGQLKGYYIVESDHHRSRRSSADPVSLQRFVDHSAAKINDHPAVEKFARETVLTRKKRDFVEFFRPIETPITGVHANRFERNPQNPNEDPFWPQMWYLNRHMQGNHILPDMNVTVAWALGYSGLGVSVTFLDDGLEWDHPDLKPNYDPKVRNLL